jgi:hypothetical protein
MRPRAGLLNLRCENMRNQKLNFWLMLGVGIPAFVWLLAELIRVFLEVVNRSGILSVPFDGVIQHKVGELMVGTPLFLILLLSNKWSKERIFALVNRTQGVMIVGGLLNGLAWHSLREREAWNSFFRVWCLILLFVGLFGSQIAKWLVSWTKEDTLSAS